LHYLLYYSRRAFLRGFGNAEDDGIIINIPMKFFIAVVLVLVGLGFYFSIEKKMTKETPDEPVTIGFFNGGRTGTFGRTFVNQYFKKEGVDVELYTKYANKGEWYSVSDRIAELKKSNTGDYGYFGVVDGFTIVEEGIKQKGFAGATVGMPTFIWAVHNNIPVVAVAALMYDGAAKRIMMRSDVTIQSPEDFKGKVLATQETGPGSVVFLKEFVKNIGLDSEKDVIIAGPIPETDVEASLRNKQIDGGYFSYKEMPRLIDEGLIYEYRKMDWRNPKLSHGLLIFRRDFLEEHPEKVQKIISAYMRMIQDEKDWAARQPEGAFSEYPPLVHVDLLQEMQRLMLEYGEIDKRVNIDDFVDNSFVDRAMDIVGKKEDVAVHLAKWQVGFNSAGFTLTDFSKIGEGTLTKETLEAQDDNTILKMTKTKTNAPAKYVGDKKFLLESLFSPTDSPYPEVITNVIECPEEFKPKVKELEQGTIYTLFAGDRFTYGICAKDLVAYYSSYGIFDCEEKGIFEVQLFAKTKEGLEPRIESFACPVRSK